MATLLLNADMGESFGTWTMGQDEAVMPFVDLANVACGFHASDPDTMRRTVKLANTHGVKVGAHPAYPDMVGLAAARWRHPLPKWKTWCSINWGRSAPSAGPKALACTTSSPTARFITT